MKEKRDDTFRKAVEDVKPMGALNRVEPFRAPAAPVPFVEPRAIHGGGGAVVVLLAA